MFCLTILRPLARTKGLVSLDYYYTKTKRHELINEENRAQANGLCKSPLVPTDFISRQDMSIGEKIVRSSRFSSLRGGPECTVH